MKRIKERVYWIKLSWCKKHRGKWDKKVRNLLIQRLKEVER